MKPTFTLEKESVRDGLGLFTGERVRITLKPLPKGSGIHFQRVDLVSMPSFRLNLSLVQGTPRCTIVGDERFSVQTVEHLMAAFHACSIDDVLVQLNGPEVPVFDGSAKPFLEMIEESGLREQGEKQVYSLSHPVFWSKGEMHLVALPSEEFRVSYTLHYPSSSRIGTQFYTVRVDRKSFAEEIAPSRTFSVYEEVLPLIEKGVLKGGGLENAVVIRDNQVANPEGLRFPDEMVRHKILDLIGDLYLMDCFFSAHIIAIRSGHYANNAFAQELIKHFKTGDR